MENILSFKPNKSKHPATPAQLEKEIKTAVQADLNEAVKAAVDSVNVEGTIQAAVETGKVLNKAFGGSKVIAAAADQAPVLPFAPYQADYYNTPYSTSLMEKSNALSAKIWNGREGYTQAQMRFPLDVVGERAEIIEKNKTFLDRSLTGEILHSILSLQPYTMVTDWTNRQRTIDTIKTIKRIEKRHGEDQVFDDVAREQIINTVLMPSNMYGVADQFNNYNYLSLRHLPVKAVVNELINADSVTVVENIINYIPKMRFLMANYQPHSGQRVKGERLLVSLNKQENKYCRNADQQYLDDVRNMAEFFNCAFPGSVVGDLIPELKYPTNSCTSYTKLRQASTELRDAAIGYMQETSTLSVLLQRIVDVAELTKEYFFCIMNENEAYFNYLNRIGMSYEQLVTESNARITDSEFPF